MPKPLLFACGLALAAASLVVPASAEDAPQATAPSQPAKPPAKKEHTEKKQKKRKHRRHRKRRGPTPIVAPAVPADEAPEATAAPAPSAAPSASDTKSAPVLPAAKGEITAPPPAPPSEPPAPPAPKKETEGDKDNGEKKDKSAAKPPKDVVCVPPKDSGKSLEWVYAKGFLGASYMNMTSFNSSDTSIALQQSELWGPSFGFSAGVRLLVFTLGARVMAHRFSAFSFWQIDGEFGAHFPVAQFDPYFGFHAGYAFSGSLDESSFDAVQSTVGSATNVIVTGADGGAQIGVDYYFNHYLSLGAEVMGSVLFLHRPPLPLPASLSFLPPLAQEIIKKNPLYAHSGDTVGYGVSFGLQLGAHF